MGRPPGAKNVKPERKLLARACNAAIIEKRNEVKSNGQGDNGQKTNRTKVNGGSKSLTNGSSNSSSDPDPTFDINYPYDLRLNGLSSILEAAKSGSKQVKETLLNECDIIFECRVCRNLFRSVPNYLTHKRTYCQDKFQKLSPKALTQLLKLAQDSFRINQCDGSTSIPGETDLEQEQELRDSQDMCTENQQGPNTEDENLSFDVNNVVSLMSSSLEAIGKSVQLPRTSLPKDSVTKDKELKNLDYNLNHRYDVLQSRRIPPDVYEKHLRQFPTGIIGPTGKCVYDGDPVVVEEIVQNLVSQIAEKQSENNSKDQLLKCSVCQLTCPTEKSLRTHVRTHAKSGEVNDRKRTIPFDCNTYHGPKVVVQEVNEYIKPPKPTQNLSKATTSTCDLTSRITQNKLSTATMGRSRKAAKPQKSNTNVETSKLNLFIPSLGRTGRMTNNSFNATLTSPPNKTPFCFTGTKIPEHKVQNYYKTCHQASSSEVTPSANTSLEKPTLSVSQEIDPTIGAEAEYYVSTLSFPSSPHKVACTKCSNSYSPKQMKDHEVVCRGVPHLPSPNTSPARKEFLGMPRLKLIRIMDHTDYSNPDVSRKEIPPLTRIRPIRKKRKERKSKDHPQSHSWDETKPQSIPFNNNENESKDGNEEETEAKVTRLTNGNPLYEQISDYEDNELPKEAKLARVNGTDSAEPEPNIVSDSEVSLETSGSSICGLS